MRLGQLANGGQQVSPCIDACDMIIMNPPAHLGKQVDYSAAFKMFEQAYSQLETHGRMYIIANKQLPYEHALRTLGGQLELLMEEAGFKILRIRKNK